MNDTMNAILKEVPEGEYVVDIIEMQSAIDRKDRTVVTWLLKIVDGQFAGCILPKRFYMVTQKVTEFLKRELRMVGVDANSPEEFEAKKTEAYGTRIRLTATTNDQGYRVYYVKEVIGKGDMPQSTTAKKTGW